MGKLDLSRVTLVTMATREHLAAQYAIRRCLDVATFADIRVYSDRNDWMENDWTFCNIPPFEGAGEPAISQWKLRDFPKDADQFAEFVLFVHWDGFIVEPAAWRDEFYSYDFIGSPWPDGVVGNDGFSLSSRRFLQTVRTLDIPRDNCFPADVAVCRHEFRGRVYPYRALLEFMGMRYAPAEIARWFSVENEEYHGSLGFHGTNTLHSVRQQGRF